MEEGPFICIECVADADLSSHIEAIATENACSFCSGESDEPIAAPLDDVCEIIRDCVERDYTDPANELMYVSREGGYQGTVYNTQELLFDVIGLELKNYDDELIDEIVNRVDCYGQDAWCERDFYGLSEHEYLTYSWSHFCNLITHKRRFFFQDVSDNLDEEERIPTDKMLKSLKNYFQEFDLFSKFCQSQTIYRVRYCKEGEELASPADLGPPPEEKAVQANRMSPSGIPMFYGSTSVATALRETAIGPGAFVIGFWQVSESITVLDLTKPPARIGFFDLNNSDTRHVANFLNEFIEELARPITRDKSTEHIDYVPTQVLTEFVRFAKFQFETGEGHIRGIIYPSAVHKGGTSLVLFATQDEVLGASEFQISSTAPWLKLLGCKAIEIAERKIKQWNVEKNAKPTLFSLWKGQ